MLQHSPELADAGQSKGKATPVVAGLVMVPAVTLVIKGREVRPQLAGRVQNTWFRSPVISCISGLVPAILRAKKRIVSTVGFNKEGLDGHTDGTANLISS